MVITLVDGDVKNDKAAEYNTNLASKLTKKLHRFCDVSINVIYGVLSLKDIEDEETFEKEIENIAKRSSFFVTLDSLLMNLTRYEKVLVSFWAAVAETKSVHAESNMEREYLRFLTLEQCEILVENVDLKHVEVACGPGTGATTLMVEVARRLSRNGPTLLVCNTTEEKTYISSTYDGVVCVKEVSENDLSKFKNIIDGTNTVTRKVPGRLWKFIRDETLVTDHMIEAHAIKKEKMDVDISPDLNSLLCPLCKVSSEAENTFIPYIKQDHPTSDYGSAGQSSSDGITEASSVDQDLKRAPVEMYYCPGCTKKFKTENGCKKHMKKVHNARRTCKPDKDNVLSKTHGFSVLFEEDGKTYTARVESPKMTYSKGKVHKDLQVKKQTELVNFQQSGRRSPKQFTQLWGTCCDPLPVDLIQIRYWETKTTLDALTGWAGLAMGVTEESMLDTCQIFSKQERTWCVCVGNCKEHGGLCTKIWEGPGQKVGSCWTDTILPRSPTKGDTAKVSLGLVVDVSNGRLGFLDLDREIVLHKFDCNFKEPVYPTFSISPSPDVSRRTMRLVSGADVEFSDRKKKLICDVLSDY